jgi:hypothetical protein
VKPIQRRGHKLAHVDERPDDEDIARPLFGTEDSMATPCSVKTSRKIAAPAAAFRFLRASDGT